MARLPGDPGSTVKTPTAIHLPERPDVKKLKGRHRLWGRLIRLNSCRAFTFVGIMACLTTECTLCRGLLKDNLFAKNTKVGLVGGLGESNTIAAMSILGNTLG